MPRVFQNALVLIVVFQNEGYSYLCVKSIPAEFRIELFELVNDIKDNSSFGLELLGCVTWYVKAVWISDINDMAEGKDILILV